VFARLPPPPPNVGSGDVRGARVHDAGEGNQFVAAVVLVEPFLNRSGVEKNHRHLANRTRPCCQLDNNTPSMRSSRLRYHPRVPVPGDSGGDYGYRARNATGCLVRAPEVSEMAVTEELRARLEATSGTPAGLRAVFAWLGSEVGSDRASGMWWAVFAETDAAET
jgi:hypothetical protein